MNASICFAALWECIFIKMENFWVPNLEGNFSKKFNSSFNWVAYLWVSLKLRYCNNELINVIRWYVNFLSNGNFFYIEHTSNYAYWYLRIYFCFTRLDSSQQSFNREFNIINETAVNNGKNVQLTSDTSSGGYVSWFSSRLFILDLPLLSGTFLKFSDNTFLILYHYVYFSLSFSQFFSNNWEIMLTHQRVYWEVAVCNQYRLRAYFNYILVRLEEVVNSSVIEYLN